MKQISINSSVYYIEDDMVYTLDGSSLEKKYIWCSDSLIDFIDQELGPNFSTIKDGDIFLSCETASEMVQQLSGRFPNVNFEVAGTDSVMLKNKG